MPVLPIAGLIMALAVAGVISVAVADRSREVDGGSVAAGRGGTVAPTTGPGAGAFRLSISEEELAAVIIDGARNGAVPLTDLAIDVEEPGSIRFSGRLDGSRLAFEGDLGLQVVNGRLDLRVLSARVGFAPLPGAARHAIEALVARAVDFDAALAKQGITLSDVHLRDNAVVFRGVAADPARVSWGAVRAALRQEASRRGSVGPPSPRERLGRGVVDGLSAPGEPLYLALGDSLARGSGMVDLRDGYVSRLHRQLRERDGIPYGLENLAVGGETSSSFLLRQLPAAVDMLRDRHTAYVTLDLGGNDFLADLRSPPCADGLGQAACRARIDATADAYLDNLDRILAGLRDAAPTATIVFLTTYNPFSLGLDTQFERDTDAALRTVNARAAAVAASHGVGVADGLAALAGTIPVTTGMGQHPPDVHPSALGHDLLAAALLKSLVD